MAQKFLIIVRHGQAKSVSFNENDHSRILTEQGRVEASSVGEKLYDMDLKPDYVLCSSAMRTRQTIEEIKKYFDEPLAIDYLHRLYNASEYELYSNINAISDNIEKLMIVAHNPGLYQLSLSLAKEGDKKLHDELQMFFPTCALAVIKFDGSWKDIASYRSKLVHFSTP